MIREGSHVCSNQDFYLLRHLLLNMKKNAIFEVILIENAAIDFFNFLGAQRTMIIY